jgi:hypothetical protein
MVMEIRPAPLHRVQRDADSGTRLAALAPIAALLLVVGAAWVGAGYRPAPIEADPALPSAADAEPLGAARGLKAAGFGFPGLALGLPVRTGAELETGRADGTIGRELVVVAGVLRSEPLPLSCPAVPLTLSRTFCHRLAALFPVGDPDVEARSTGTPAPGPMIAGHLLPGTEVPGFLAAVAAEVGPLLKPSIPVVLAGRFDDPRAPACGTGHEWCRSDFVVENAVWADGLWLGTPVVRDPALPEPEPNAASRAGAFSVPGSGRSRIILGQALLRPELLAAVDPIAARAAVNTHGPVWYVRSIAAVQAGEKPQVGWLVIEAATGVLLGYSWAQP